MAFSRIRPHPLGTRVSQLSHVNARIPISFGPFLPRHMYHMIWPILLGRVPRIIKQSKVQRAKGWEASRISIPPIFLGKNVSSGKSAKTMLKQDIPAGDKVMHVVSNHGFEIG